MPTGTVTFLFTDIENGGAVGAGPGSETRLWASGAIPDAMRHAVARHNAIVRETIDAHHGCVFKTVGDGFCAAFAHASDAVAAASRIQNALFAERWITPAPLRVCMALHTGEVELSDGDYSGPPLNHVARLLAAAHGGQVLLSQATAHLVRDALPEGVSWRDLGDYRLRDLERPEHIFQLAHPALPVGFPPLDAAVAAPADPPAAPPAVRAPEPAAAVAEDRRPEGEEQLLQSAVSAGLLREFAGDREMFLSLLAQALETTVPERLEVDRGSGWFGRDRTLRRIQLDLGDYRYRLEVRRGGALAATRTRVVRGIALKTEEIIVEEWLAELSRALVEYARTHEQALDALKRRVW